MYGPKGGASWGQGSSHKNHDYVRWDDFLTFGLFLMTMFCILILVDCCCNYRPPN